MNQIRLKSESRTGLVFRYFVDTKRVCSYSDQQVAPQAAKTMSPPFAAIGGFIGGPSNSFGQMPTGAAPTTMNGANYSHINARASLNSNGYGGWSLFCHSTTLVRLLFLILEQHCHQSKSFLSLPGGSQSAAQFPSRAAEAVWPQWQGQQQHAQNHMEQHPQAQGNQQDMFPVSHWRLCFSVFAPALNILAPKQFLVPLHLVLIISVEPKTCLTFFCNDYLK